MKKAIYNVIAGITILTGCSIGCACAAEELSPTIKLLHTLSLPLAIILAILLALVTVILRRRIKAFEQKVVTSHDILEVTLERTQREVERVRQACELVSLAYYEYDVLKGVFTGDKNFYNILVGEVRPYLSVEEVLDHVHPDDRVYMAAYTSIVNGKHKGETSKVEGRIIDANGDLHYMKVYAKSYYDSDGNLQCRRGSMLDITEEKMKEIELSIINSQLEYVQNMANVFTWEINSNNPDYIKVCKGLFDFIGEEYKEENKLPVSFLKAIVSEEDYNNMRLGLRNALAKGKPFETTLPLYPINSSEVKYVHIMSFTNNENSYLKDGDVMGVMHDITALKNAEKRVGQSEKMKALGRLSSSIAHDFNNQLSGILGFAELIRTEDISDTVAEYNNMIIDRGEKSSELIRKLLDFSRNQREDAELVDVDELIIDTISFFSHLIDKSITIHKNIVESGLGILGNYNELQNALLNLAINARDSLQDKQGTIIFDVSSVFLTDEEATNLRLNVGKFVIISVVDNGHGMSDEVKEKVLEPFFTTKPDGQGTGLGLSTVHGTISSLAGGIDIISRVDEGTTVKLYIPAASSDMIAETKKTKKENKLKLGVGNVLLIDDDKTLVKLVTMQLEKAGYEVTGMNDPVEAVEYYENNYKQYDLVILDMIMPNMNGSEVFRELKKVNNNVKTILMTGYAAEDLFEQARKEGMEFFLTKPVTLTALTQMVAKVLGAEEQEVYDAI